MSPKKKAKKAPAHAAKRKPAKKATAKKRPVKKARKAKAAKPAGPALQSIGKITHYFPHVYAGVIKLTGNLKTGEMIQIKGHTTDFKQTVESIQIEHVAVNEANKGQEIGLKVKDRVRIGDIVYKV